VGVVHVSVAARACVIGKRTTNSLPGVKRNDWWELTSFETNLSVDLFGYRFNVSHGNGSPGIDTAWTNLNHVIIRPRESVIFVKNLSGSEFKDWWGATNLPVDLQVITYQGGGLGLNPTNDAVTVWNPGATANEDEFYATDWFQPNAPPGVSFACDPAVTGIGYCSRLSVAGVDGAVTSRFGGDVGSPGYIHAPTEPRVFAINREPTGWRLTWRSVVTGSYVVQRSDDFSAGGWQDLKTLSADGPTTSFLDSSANAGQGFYRVILWPRP